MDESEKKVSEEELVDKYQKHYDANVAHQLLKKLRKSTRGKSKIIAGPAGTIVGVLGNLISALENPAMPTHYKALVIGAIGYIILPVDLIPDVMPVVGWTDDLASAGGVAAAISAYSNFSLEELDAEIDEEENGQTKVISQVLKEQSAPLQIDQAPATSYDSTSNELKALENYIPKVQTIVSESKSIDFQTLKEIEDLLDGLEDKMNFIPRGDMNNIERCQRKLLALFNRCENKDDIQIDIELISESLNKILGK